MINFRDETLNAIQSSGQKLEDVMFIGSQDGKYRMSLAKFLTLSNFTYDCGYGAPEIAGDLIVYFNDNTYMTRGEYDGSEWWEYNEPLVYDKEDKYEELERFNGGMWKSVERLNNKEKYDDDGYEKEKE